MPRTMHAQFYCDMGYFDVDCIPAHFSAVIMVPIKTTPPCSVKVTLYGEACDNAVELLDMNVFYDEVQPPGCATRADYEATKPLGATTAVIGLVNCGESCCYQVVEACKSGGTYVITTTNPLPMTDPCPVPNTDPNCRVFWCAP